MSEKPNPLYLIPAALMTAAMLPIIPLAIVLRYLNDQPPQTHFPSIRCPACGECNCDECRRLRDNWRNLRKEDKEHVKWLRDYREMRERFRS